MTLLLLGLFLVALAFTLVWSRRSARRVAAAIARLDADLAGSDIRRVSAANCVGHDTPGLGQIRGWGALGLTGTQLRFVLGQPARAVSIPLTQIVETTTVRVFGGGHFARTRRRPVLIVHWVTGSGVRHRIGWDLPEAFTWAATIAQLIGR